MDSRHENMAELLRDKGILQLTDHTRKLIAKGKMDEAKGIHCATVDRAFETAEQGGIINLTDLMASGEVIHIQECKKELSFNG